MGTITELLEALRTKEAAVSTADLAGELKASKEGTLKQLTREKEKGNVEGNSQEGWLITETGRKALDKGEIHPSMIDEGVTPRQQFEGIGRRIGIKEDRIVLATDIVWSGDYNDVKWAWEALGQAALADDLRRLWVNAWRAKLQKGIPPELETELTGVPSPAAEGETGEGIRAKGATRDFIIMDEQPVRVGPNLGDYGLQDAKDILSIRALRGRFGAAGQPAAGQAAAGQPGGTAEKVSEILLALGPYIKKEGSDVATLKEIIGDKLELQKQDILSRIPQPGQPAQPKTFMEQITEVITVLGTLKEAGPTLRSILGIQEQSNNPVSTDLDNDIKWKKFQGDERRADERQAEIAKTLKVGRENLPDGIQAILQTVAELKGGAGAKTPLPPPQQVFQCGDCKTQFSPPPGWAGEPVKCPNQACGREYSKEELLET